MDSDIEKNFINCIKCIADKLKSDNNYVNKEYILEFKEKCDAIESNIESILNENRVLRIGIVGEVKAGKSSFLNALIFDGKDILPKAATPMTAALTKISYGKSSNARVVFYNDYDWDKVKIYSNYYDCELKKLYAQYHASKKNFSSQNDKDIKKSLEENIPIQYRSCKELTEIAKNNHINIGEYLNKSINIAIDELDNYIGVDGKFTCIVKHIELQLNNPILKDIELIDTPGLNDPILSRSDTTKKFLMNCDVVFLLSYTGQFLNNEDINFLIATLPNEGIGKAILIGSKFDSAILDYPKKKATFVEALVGSRRKFDEQAKSNINSCLNSDYRSQVLMKIKNSLPPQYISSLMFSIAQKMKEHISLDESEEHIIKQYQKRFKDFQISYDFLIDFSNIYNIKKNTFKEVFSEKDKIIKEKSNLLLKGQKNKLLSILEDINIQACQNLSDINNYDKNKLEKKLEMIEEKVSSIRIEIKNIFNMCAIDAKRVLTDIDVDIEKEVDKYTNIKINQRTEEHRETYNEGIFGIKKVTYKRTDTIYSVDVSNVISNIRKYITKAKNIANEEFSRLININELKKNIKETVIAAFDLSDKNFNENDVLVPIELVMKKIIIPTIDINISDYDEMILKNFSSGTVEGQEINQLKVKQEIVLQEIYKHISSILKNTESKISNILEEQANMFVDNIINQLSTNIRLIEKKLEDKDNSIKEYKKFINKIKTYKGEIIKIKA
ncbi:dynamin family protein [Clostridium tyrobutyricum]|uniref:dynamin family protein n=1 Tax=Clostridium tyrobutyricum TaxID=1519 RepID=UPI0011C6F321|nr:dynamin family protein [Clostridium tyrobutyricum]